MKKIRIIHCLGRLNAGGAETLVMNIFRKIDRKKYNFDFLVFSDTHGFYDDEVKHLGGNIFYTPSISKVGILKYIKYLIDFFRENSPDVVHSHMDWQGGFIAYAASKAGIKKIIVHSHANQKMFESNFIYHFLIEINKRLIHKYATDCLACSNIAGKSLFKNDFTLLFNGIDTNRFIKPNEKIIGDLKKEFNIKEDEVILGSVGSLSENKNHTFLIDILHGLQKYSNKYRLIIVGDGVEKENLKNKINNYGLKDYVYFAGIRKEIPEIMSTFDIFLLPSKMEGLGIVAIEAQASGLYCIVSSTVPKDIAIDDDHVDFCPLDNKKWIDKIIAFKNKKRVDSNKIISSFDISKTVEKLERIYDGNGK
ncbi:glycosyltransferase [Thomasclavelia sp.]|uniref:glycosyltransferase n=1 Tax=Thomasclavelia sp. TaxID=3025757 RepID=UPI0025D1E226|nr:glycosyltransferase [Thomasclavelia sp.]